MGLWSRFTLLWRAKANAAMSRAEDPRETTAYAIEAQQDLLLQVRRGLVDVATARHRIGQQAGGIRDRIAHLEEQARLALEAQREDLARSALERRQRAVSELASLEAALTGLGEEEERLIRTEQALGTQIEEFRSRRDILVARYTASQARIAANGALTGISGELAELGRAITRAEEDTEELEARAAALDAFLEPVPFGFLGTRNSLDGELKRISQTAALERELQSMKREIAEAGARPLIIGPDPDDRPHRDGGVTP